MKSLFFSTRFFLILFLIFVSGCSSRSFVYPDAKVQSKSGELLLRTDVYQTENNKYKADFGTLVVSENKTQVNSRLIELPVIRIYSSSSSPKEPILILNGGPGASNMKFIPPDYLLKNHDVIMVGYRGADGSSILHCPEVSNMLDTDEDVLSESYLKILGIAWKKCASRLSNSGVNLDRYTMLDVIEDMELARRALGYKRINLLSSSYGTRVAYLYSLKKPEIIHRSAMIGVTPPGHFGWEPKMIDEQLKYYAELWSIDPELTDETPDLLATMKNVAKNMPKHWLFFEINPSKVKLATFISLYHRDGAAKVFDAYVAAENGDPSGLAFMSLAYNFALPKSVIWGDFIAKSYSADFNSNRDYLKELDPDDSIIGSPLGKLAWGSMQYSDWPTKSLPERVKTLQETDVETLIISGSVDFSTPAELSTIELLPYLANGQQVVISEVGHRRDIYQVQPEITESLLVSFYNTGVADESNNTYIPMNFDPGWSWTNMSKASLGAVSSLLLLLLL